MVIHDTTVVGGRQAAIDWLWARINYERTLVAPYNERQLKLDRMRTLLTRLGQPDAGMKIVHVAGTKGKGSTAAMIAAMLTAAGYRTGVFSSPHLERIEERFAVDGEPCSCRRVGRAGGSAAAGRRGDGRRGRGGRRSAGRADVFRSHDRHRALALCRAARSTRPCWKSASAAGSIRRTSACPRCRSSPASASTTRSNSATRSPRSPAKRRGSSSRACRWCAASRTRSRKRVIARIAQEHGCRLIQADRDFRYRYHDGRVDFEYAVAGQEHCLEDVPLAMRGPHQAANAAVALATIAELRHQGWCVSIDAMRRGLAQATLPGRVEFLPGEPNVVLDTAHNPASAKALVSALAEIASVGRRTLILSVSRDKDVRAIVRELVPHFDRVVVTQYQENPRAVPAGDLAELVRAEMRGNDWGRSTVCATPREAWETVCRTAEPGELVCIAGSFYLAAELRPLVVAPCVEQARPLNGRRPVDDAAVSCRHTPGCFLRRAVRLRAACRTRAVPSRRPSPRLSNRACLVSRPARSWSCSVRRS